MPALIDMIEGSRVEHHRPWPRVVTTRAAGDLPSVSSAAGHWTLLGLWGETGTSRAHGGARRRHERDRRRLDRVSRTGAIRRSARMHPPAIRLERAIRDLFGLVPVGLPDTRPWLDLGFWDVAHPLGERRAAAATRAPYAFLPVEGEGLHQIPVGPVHAGIIEPGHFRFTANGETVVRLEERLGYVHKGIESLMAGRHARTGGAACRPHLGRQHGRLCAGLRPRGRSGARTSQSPPRARLSARADGGARAARQPFRRHRRDLQRCVVRHHARAMRHPARAHAARGGCLLRPSADDGPRRSGRRRASTSRPDGADRRADAAGRGRAASFRGWSSSTTTPPRCRTAPSPPASCAPRWRGSSAPAAMSAAPAGAPSMPARRCAIRPMTGSMFEMPLLSAGDVNARVWIRIREVEQSLALIEQILAAAAGRPDPDRASPPQRGDRTKAWDWSKASAATCWSGCASTDGRVARCHLRDPSWFQWPLLEAVIEGNIVADFPLCNKSFNCSYSGHDL